LKKNNASTKVNIGAVLITIETSVKLKFLMAMKLTKIVKLPVIILTARGLT